MPKYVNRYLRLKVWPNGAKEPITFTQDWKITFNVRKCASAITVSYNTAEINIYNMTPQLRDLLSQKYMIVELEAGYLDDYTTIFAGYLYNLITVKNATELVTTLYCGSNTQAFGKTVNKCVQNVSVTDLIAQLCEEYGVSYRLPFKRDDVVQKSYTGSFGRVLALICKEYDILWTIENGQALFRDRKVAENQVKNSEVRVFTPISGLLGNPQVTEVGVRIHTLMHPALQVTDYFRLEAPYTEYSINNISTTPGLILGNDLNVYAHITTHTYNGLYMALSINVSGDTRGNAWYTDVEGSKIWPQQNDEQQ